MGPFVESHEGPTLHLRTSRGVWRRRGQDGRAHQVREEQGLLQGDQGRRRRERLHGLHTTRTYPSRLPPCLYTSGLPPLETVRPFPVLTHPTRTLTRPGLGTWDLVETYREGWRGLGENTAGPVLVWDHGVVTHFSPYGRVIVIVSRRKVRLSL